MTLKVNAITWDSNTIGGADADVYLDAVEGFGQPPFSRQSTPRAQGGSWGGRTVPQEHVLTAEAWVDCQDGTDPTALDFTKLHAIRDSMTYRPNPDDVLPLQWSALGWEGEWCYFAQPARCEWLADEESTHNGAPGLDLQWVAADPTAYSAEQTTAKLVNTGSPVSTTTFEAPNAGGYRSAARYAWEFRMTAHGTTTNPRIRVDHDDGTFEQWLFSGLTMTGGQVLTIIEGIPRVAGSLVTGYVRVTTDKGGPGYGRRPFRLLASDGEDGKNEVTMSVSSGTFSGFCKVRSTR